MGHPLCGGSSVAVLSEIKARLALGNVISFLQHWELHITAALGVFVACENNQHQHSYRSCTKARRFGDYCFRIGRETKH